MLQGSKMKIISIFLTCLLLSCATTSNSNPTVAHKSRAVSCTDTLENCVKLVNDVCVRHYIPMLAEGPFEDGTFKVTFECMDK
jgi:hypothetical protein